MSKYIDLTGHPITPVALVDQSGNLLEADDTDGQAILFAKARNYVWDPIGLSWIRALQVTSGAGGGGPATIIDGGDVTQGLIADLKIVGDNPGTISAKLRGINTALANTLTVGGTVTANAGTNLNTSLLALEAGGNLATVAQSVVAQAAALGTTKNQLQGGSVTTNVPTYVAGNINPLSLDTSGLLRASLKDTPANTNNLNVNLAASAATVTTNPPANATTNVVQFGGTNVSTGTGTGGVGIPRVTVSNDSQVKVWDGTTVAAVIAGTTALKSDLSSVAGTATVVATAGVQKVGIVGNAGATVDSTIGAATAPTNALTIAVVNNTSAPSLTTGQAVAAQGDYEGSLFVKPYRRAQTVTKATTIASSAASTTVLAAQAAGIFADISNLIITVTPAATADIAFTATFSDGTNSFIYDMDTGALATATADPTQVNITFNPPLPATTAATAWTITLSVATVTVHITVVAILQKAS